MKNRFLNIHFYQIFTQWPQAPYCCFNVTWTLMYPFSLPFQVEADLGYPGGKAKIIHKESDIIMAFAINKVCLNL